ncbi:MAG: hypothetical protein A3H70_02495 [Candidatus Komeilibacteria bacterium RIFCSPLOWO2_02_FULL_48_11]|uniref:General secretion pathway GspH domain-containing protein n=1 Tax=Candidatus Komeilibacteria bacterium RIFCSPLOWO2_02_FULL_48_11 TaxID=1798553 RepID=A0A1G2BQ10_9BACT|nr:MAG: hypothetical protein A3H70_02495 [Candidatus Komeilibacteria bacterium RIFCSPLOWO2_02_FULL_48_11]
MISKNNHQGATLVELIISIGIMGVLIGATISNFHGGNKNESVRLAARLGETVLRQAQTMTLTGALTSGSFPSGGYGARFDIAAPTIIRLFADSNNNHVFDANEEVADERRQLPANASFALGGSLDVVFSSPEGTVFFNGADAPDTQAILFNAAGSPITKSVIIYRLSGQVRVQ